MMKVIALALLFALGIGFWGWFTRPVAVNPGRYEGMVNLTDCLEMHANRTDYCR